MAGSLVDETTDHARAGPRPRLSAHVRDLALLGLGWAKARELAAVAVGSALLAVAMTWPTARDVKTRYLTTDHDIHHGLNDSLLIAWELAWPGHALRHQPLDPWQANAFYPEPDTFAFTDSFFGYAPLSLVGSGPESAMVRYNLVVLLLTALAFFGAYVLARQLGARWPGALIAGAAFAYAPWRIAQAGHLHVLSTGGIALAFAALARGHGYSFRHGYRAERVDLRWVAAGWALACWQLTIGFGIGLPFAYALALVGVLAVAGWLVTGRRPVPGRLLLANAAGGVALALVSYTMARPYLNVAARFPEAIRTEQDLAVYAPPARGLITAPPESWLWGDLHAGARAAMNQTPEVTLLPGFAVALLALLGLAVSVWPVRMRLLLAVGVLATAAFGMGPRFPGGGTYTYLLLFRYGPGWDAIRTTGRMVLWTTLCLALLAAGAATAIHERLGRLSAARAEPGGASAAVPADASGAREAARAGSGAGRRRAVRPAQWALAAVLCLAVLAEGVQRLPHPTVQPEPVAMRGLTGPALVLPTDPQMDKRVMLWSTDGFPKITNGESGFRPTVTDRVRAAALAFPDAASVAFLRRLGVRTVLVVRANIAGGPFAKALTRPIAGLPMRRTATTPEAVVFTLDPS